MTGTGLSHEPARDALFSGEIVNPSEGRPATHVAERGSGAPADVDLATARRQRMRELLETLVELDAAVAAQQNAGPEA